MKPFLLFLVFFLIGVAILLTYQYLNSQQLSLGYPKPAMTTKYSLEKAPSDSLQGIIASMSGSVIWLSRTANKSIKLRAPRTIQQGEEISTGSNGKVVVRIQNDTSLLLQPNTHVSIIQLLPQNFVFMQDKGLVHYVNTIHVPVSIRSFDLVTIINEGIISLSVDPKTQTIAVTVEKGTVREGYEDLQNTSTVVTVNAGQTFLFDETNKIGTIQ
jgi:hypothetical protein